MAFAMISRSFLRSVLYRCRWQQSQIRPLCKGPPDDPSDVSKGAEPVAGDRQYIIVNETEEEILKASATEKASVVNSGTDNVELSTSDEKQEVMQNAKSIVDDEKDKQEVKQKSEVPPEQSVKEPVKSAENIPEDKRAAAKKKLNDLLISLATTDPVPVEPILRVKLSKPKPRKKADKKKPKEEDQKQGVVPKPPPSEDIQIEPELVAATKEVAESLGGDVKATESELLSTLRSHASETSFDDKPTTNISELFVGMKVVGSLRKPVMEQRQHSRYDRDPSSPSPEPELAAATKEVAESLGGDVKTTESEGDIKTTESELLSTLRSHSSENSLDDKPTTNLSELFVGMKVERTQRKPVMEQRQRSRYDRDPTPSSQSESSGFQYKKSWAPQPGRPREHVTVDLFGSKKLDIFDTLKMGDDKSSIGESVLPTWDAAHQRQLQLAVTHPPSNAFIEMIHWTKQGKLWPFPIDNEIGLEEEKKVGFHEHVFLERHLEGWCPRRGPIRHFMELVCTGLSKNPHLTVERKMRHINWYKNYFENKQEILKEIGAIEAEQ